MDELNDLQLAFAEWIKHFPKLPGGYCCAFNHTYNDGSPKPDDQVCARERAWRKYLIIRDGYKH